MNNYKIGDKVEFMTNGSIKKGIIRKIEGFIYKKYYVEACSSILNISTVFLIRKNQILEDIELKIDEFENI